MPRIAVPALLATLVLAGCTDPVTSPAETALDPALVAEAATAGAVGEAVAPEGSTSAPAPPPPPAPPPIRRDGSDPLMLLHGYDFAGAVANDGTMWNGLLQAFRAWGWTGPVAVWRYYGCDTDHGYDMHLHGSHDAHRGGPESHAHGENMFGGDRGDAACGRGHHDRYTPIEHLGYHLAWGVHERFGDACVSVVAHSMGGLIARYALAQVAAGHPEFPRSLCIGNVVTLGTPHAGASAISQDSCQTIQSCQMAPGSQFLAGLAASPQGRGGTAWTLVGSDADDVVSGASATSMPGSRVVRYAAASEVHHDSTCNFMHATCTTAMCDADSRCFSHVSHQADDRTAAAGFDDLAGQMRSSAQAPWPARWAYQALRSPTGFGGDPPGTAPPVEVLAREQAFAVTAETTAAHRFTLASTANVAFDAKRTDGSTVDVALVRAADLDGFAEARAVTTWGYHGAFTSASGSFQLQAGDYGLALRCRNSFADCDGTYSLEVRRP